MACGEVISNKIEELENLRYLLTLSGGLNDAEKLYRGYLAAYNELSCPTSSNECGKPQILLKRLNVLSCVKALGQEYNVFNEVNNEVDELCRKLLREITKFVLEDLVGNSMHYFALDDVVRISYELLRSSKESLAQFESKLSQFDADQDLEEIVFQLNLCHSQIDAVLQFISERCFTFLTNTHKIQDIKFCHICLVGNYGHLNDLIVIQDDLPEENGNVFKFYTFLYHASVTFLKYRLSFATGISKSKPSHMNYLTSYLSTFYNDINDDVGKVIWSEKEFYLEWKSKFENEEFTTITLIHGDVDMFSALNKYFITLSGSRDPIIFTDLRTNLNEQMTYASDQVVRFCTLIKKRINAKIDQELAVVDTELFQKQKDHLNLLSTIISIQYRFLTTIKSKLVEYFFPLNISTSEKSSRLVHLFATVLTNYLECGSLLQIHDISTETKRKNTQAKLLIGCLDTSLILESFRKATDNLNDLVKCCELIIRFVALHWLSDICHHVQSMLADNVLIEIAYELRATDADTYERLLGAASKIVFRESKRLLVDIFEIGGGAMKLNSLREILTRIPKKEDKLSCLKQASLFVTELEELSTKLPGEYNFVKLSALIKSIFDLVSSFVKESSYRENLFGLGVAFNAVPKYKRISPLLLEICFNTIGGIERISKDGSLHNFPESVKSLIEKYSPLIYVISLAV